MVDLNVLAQEIHSNAVEKGFWDVVDADEKAFACMHCELSEAIQEDRKGNPRVYVDDIFEEGMVIDIEHFGGRKPEGVAVELADFVMRLLDWTVTQCIKLDELETKKYRDYFDRYRESELPGVVNATHELICQLWNGVIYKREAAQIIGLIVDGIYGWLKVRNIDLFQIIQLKMEYNKSRPVLHGRLY